MARYVYRLHTRVSQAISISSKYHMPQAIITIYSLSSTPHAAAGNPSGVRRCMPRPQ